MHHIDNEAVMAAETDGPAAQCEPKNPVQLSTFSSDLPIHSSKRSLISITTESKNSLRCVVLDALTLDVSGDFKGVESLSQPGKNGGPRKSNEENFQDQTQVQSVSAPNLQVPVEVAAAVTIGYWLML